MSNTPSPFLRQAQSEGNNMTADGSPLVRDAIVEHLVGCSDTELTRLLTVYTTSPADTPQALDSLAYDTAMRFNISAHWLARCIKARVLDRWLEGNA